MYLDHNATSPMPTAVRDAVVDAMDRFWANPSSPHRLGQAASVQVEQARRVIAERAGVAAKTVHFTSGATEGNAWVLAGQSLPVIASAVEHPSVLAWASETIGADTGGVIDTEALDRRLAEGPAVVSVMAANNETGVIQPVEEIAQICKARGARLHCDATQWFGRFTGPLFGDWITVSAHKFGGPRGVGAMISGLPPTALLQGGKQERGHRAGTLNVPGIIGFGAAINTTQQWDATRGERDKLEQYCLKVGGKTIGTTDSRLPNTASILFDVPGDLIVPALDLQGVQASTGSACSSGANQASHVLKAMSIEGTPVRFSFGPDSKAQPAIDALEAVLGLLEASCE